MPDGRILYSDVPVPGALSVRPIRIEPIAEGARHEHVSPQADLLRQADARASRLRQLDQMVNDAYETLQAVQREQVAGRDVVEGERQGRRLLPSYADRQRSLQSKVLAATQRLEQLVQERSALQP